ncbi:hypothetical protein ACPPVT_07300 [Angustibacter sp. McL0619]|uniref:hypothetical protein n=1 Tax=Angustibacter sp. McL0619 TaxID=3415676 RepID=UPI003CF70127
MTSAQLTPAERWAAYWREVGNEEWLAARELIELCPRLWSLFAGYIEATGERPAGWWLDWPAACAYGLDEAGLSGGEHRLAQVVAGLVLDDHPVRLYPLSITGSWSREKWRVLVEWGTDGELTVTPGPGQSQARRARTDRATSTTSPRTTTVNTFDTDRGGL